MAMRLNPYLSFSDNAREAMEHYRDIFGGDLTISTFGDFGQTGTPIENLIMHSQLETTAGFTLMGSDTPPGVERHQGNNVSIVISGDDEATMRGYWEGLCDGATIDVPLERQMWGDMFGMCTDKYGTVWQVNIASATG